MKLFKFGVALSVIVPINLATFAILMMTYTSFIPMVVISSVIFILSLFISAYVSNKETRLRRLSYIKNYKFPEIVAKKFMADHKNLSVAQVDQIGTALKQFFMAFALTKDGGKKPTDGFVMPSRIVDELWHHFMLDSANYQKFCQKAYGEMFHHKPGMDTEGNRKLHLIESFPQSVKDTYEYIEKLRPYGEYRELNDIAILFAIDSHLKIHNGYYYDTEVVNNITKPYAGVNIKKTVESVKVTKSTSKVEKNNNHTSSCGGMYMGFDSPSPATNSVSTNNVLAATVVDSNISGGGSFSGGGSTVSNCSAPASAPASSCSSCSGGSSCGGGGGGGD